MFLPPCLNMISTYRRLKEYTLISSRLVVIVLVLNGRSPKVESLINYVCSALALRTVSIPLAGACKTLKS